jgi:serine protease
MTPVYDDGSFGRDDMIVLRLEKPTPVTVEDLSKTRGPIGRFLVTHDVTSRRAISSVPPKRLLAWEADVKDAPFRPRHSLTTYWLLDARHGDEPVPRLVSGLRRVDGVAEAYKLPRYRPAVTTPVNDPYYAAAHQGYLDAAPAGIDADWAWRLRPSCDGSAVRFVDVELGWQSGHEDVVLPPLIGGANVAGTYLAFHGLGVLGIVCARTNNAKGVAAVAPGAAGGWIASGNYGGVVKIADALAIVRSVASPGDVVLLEVQTEEQWPVESRSLDRDAILLAVSAGLVVVEAAGNAGVDLATVPGIVASVDSGAIVVGAGTSQVPHARYPNSNWGTRVDCYAWGDSVYTAGGFGTSPTVPDPGSTAANRYTRDFAATSAAAAIVAGAALIVQGAYKRSTLGIRTSAGLRGLLRASGTAGAGPDPIGRMPDLRQLLPDIYVRDNLTDTGNVPAAGAVSISPDVIVTTATVANPQGTYGAGSPNENVATLGEVVEFGQTNYVYVRLKNRGTGIAARCTASVYWSDVATLVTPSSWKLIGTTPPVDVGPALTVTDALPWNSVPATGHYCFVAIVSHPLDPAPVAPTGSWTDFVAYIRDNNNVTWRNFNVVDVLPNKPAPAPFKIMGAPDSQRVFDFEIVRDPGDRTIIDFEVPLTLKRRFPTAALPKPTVDNERKVAIYRLPRRRLLPISHVTLPARATFECRFVIRGAPPGAKQLPTVAIRQLFKRFEVGRVTWAYRTRRR